MIHVNLPDDNYSLEFLCFEDALNTLKLFDTQKKHYQIHTSSEVEYSKVQEYLGILTLSARRRKTYDR